MRISRVEIANFRNFDHVDLTTSSNLVIVGENKVGKSNFIRALRLVLDPSISETDRQLKVEDFWDGLDDAKIGSTIEVSVELTDFDGDARLMAHLCDHLVDPGPPMVARLTYRFRPKADLLAEPTTLADYEFVLFGGNDEANAVSSATRKMLPMDVLGALRDAEGDLASWRRSPLRPLIEELTQGLSEEARNQLDALVTDTQETLENRPEISSASGRIADRLEEIAGDHFAVDVRLGLAPTNVDILLRGLRLLIDGGARTIGDASLGTANLLFLALKTLELDRLVADGDRDHTFLAVEEPEAHLHPHVQRLVYRHLLKTGTPSGAASATASNILTTHSPHVTSVAPIRSIILLRQSSSSASTAVTSTADAELTSRDEADLERYIDVNRGEIFFARGVVLVEGDAEKFLVPAFARKLGISLDELGVTVCAIGGTNFTPYVKLLGARGLAVPYVVLTDRDPIPAKQPLVQGRFISILRLAKPGQDFKKLTLRELLASAGEHGCYSNKDTLETELFRCGTGELMKQALVRELRIGGKTQALIDTWIADTDSLDGRRLIRLIDRVGKGRFAQIIARRVKKENCPPYMRKGLRHIRDAVT